MGALLCAIVAVQPVGASPPAARTPSDAELLAPKGLGQDYAALLTLRADLDRAAQELRGVQADYEGRTAREPGGERRRRSHDRLAHLLAVFRKRRAAFRDKGLNQRPGAAIAMALGMRKGRKDKVAGELDVWVRHEAILQDCAEIYRDRSAILQSEEKTYAQAVRRYEAERLRRRRFSGAAGAAAAALLLILRRWSRPRPTSTPASMPAAPSLRHGTRVGRYGLLRDGRPWAFGARFDAIQDETRKPVSLGRLDPRHYPRPTDAARFIEKLRSTGAFKHPGLAEFVEAFLSGGIVYLVTARPAGEPLASLLGHGSTIPLGNAWPTLRAVADVLDRAHSVGLIHGGLTPDRIIVGAAGEVRVEDAGLAPLCAALAPSDPAYAAPEQESGRVMAQSDIYALGVIVYESVAGRRPVGGARSAPPTRLDPNLPSSLDSLVAGLLNPDPALRRPRPGDLRQALDGIHV